MSARLSVLCLCAVAGLAPVWWPVGDASLKRARTILGAEGPPPVKLTAGPVRSSLAAPATHPAVHPVASTAVASLAHPRTRQQVLPDVVLSPEGWADFAPERLRVVPLEGLGLTFTATRVAREAGRSVWVGNGELPGSTLVAVGSSVGWVGLVTLPEGNQYQVNIAGEAVQVWEHRPETEHCALAPGVAAGDLRPEVESGVATADAIVAAQVAAVEVAVFYDEDTEALIRGWSGYDATSIAEYVRTEAQAKIEWGNLALQRSGVTSFQWQVAGAYRLPSYTRTGLMLDDIRTFAFATNPAGQFALDVAQALGADQALLFVAGTRDFAGMAYQPGKHSVVQWQRSAFTVAHELAHNFGCRHDRGTEGAPDGNGISSYGYTLPAPNSHIGTIMSYARDRVPFFSNPDLTVVPSDHGISSLRVGVRIGVPDGDSRAANNARQLREQAAAMAGYRTYVPAPPKLISESGGPRLVPTGASLALQVVAAGGGALTYQWRRNGAPIPGATASTLNLAGLQRPDGGTYDVVVSNSHGARTSLTHRLAVVPKVTTADAKLANLSTRSWVGTGSQVQIAGFVIRGDQPKEVLIRAAGPALGKFAVAGVVNDPFVELHRGDDVLASNDNWDAEPTQAVGIERAAQRIGAFAFDRGSKDAALHLTLEPGAYSAVVSGRQGTTGIGLIEAYELDAGGARLVNISTRATVRGGDEVQIAGFVIRGTEPKTVLVRASGPALAAFGVAGALADPVIDVRDAADVLVGSNHNWGDTPQNAVEVEVTSAVVGAFAWAPNSKDAGLVLTLTPGSYSAVVRGAGEATGVALVEVYEVN